MANTTPSPESVVTAHIARQIRLRRKAMGLSQTALGHLLGVTFQQLQKYERGVNRISATRLYQLAHVLQTNLDYFYAGLSPTVGATVVLPPPIPGCTADMAQRIQRLSRAQRVALVKLLRSAQQ